jgi:hypothetical protein
VKIDSRKRGIGRKSSISKSGTYAEIGNFWDEHDLSDYWGKTHPVVNLWLQEKIQKLKLGSGRGRNR